VKKKGYPYKSAPTPKTRIKGDCRKVEIPICSPGEDKGCGGKEFSQFRKGPRARNAKVSEQKEKRQGFVVGGKHRILPSVIARLN